MSTRVKTELVYITRTIAGQRYGLVRYKRPRLIFPGFKAIDVFVKWQKGPKIKGKYPKGFWAVHKPTTLREKRLYFELLKGAF